MTMWILFGVMLLAASLMAVWPLYRQQRRLSAISVAVVIAVVGLSASLYSAIGTPKADSAQAEVASVDAMVATLAAKLQQDPENLEGWKMLGRSYMQLENPPQAIAAFEAAVKLENSSNGETLISLGEALLASDPSTLAGRAGQLFESGLALAPGHPRALFYGGLAAAQRGANLLAADRWQAFLEQSPPPEIEDTLRKRIAAWRGEPLIVAKQPAVVDANADTVISIDIRVAEVAAAAIDPTASVFIIARDPAQPSPPIAVVRRQAGELPLVVALGDANAMVPGRVPSAYEELEVIVRVSGTGQPIAQSGDWFGQGLFGRDQGDSISIIVDQRVP